MFAARFYPHRRVAALGASVSPIPPMPTWIPGPNDPTIVPTEQIDLLPPVGPDGVIYSWYNPVDWAKGAWKGAKSVGGWVWEGGKWVFKKAISPCTYFMGITLPAQHVPGLKKIVKENGCSPRGQMLGSAVAAAYVTSIGGPLAGFAAQVGAGIFYDCLCKKWQTELDLPPEKQGEPEQQASALSTPMIIGIVGLLAAAAYNFASTRGKPKAPVVVSAPPAATPKAEPKSVKPKPKAPTRQAAAA